MTPRSRTVILAALLGVGTAALYLTRLDYSPVYLMHDEAKFVLQAQSIAASGRDLAGRFFPIFFTEPEFPAGRDPAIIYATAAALTVLPLSERSARLPTAIVGVINSLLMFFVARRLGLGDPIAVVAALFMALTPAHFIRSRLALSPLYSIPFVLAWIYCVASFLTRPAVSSLAAAGVWLGLGVYTYLGCVVMMPIYLLVTMWLAYRTRGIRGVAIVTAAAAIALVPMTVWFLTHPERYGQLVEAYRLFGTGSSDASAVRVDRLYDAARLRLSLYWSFFSPDFLFISGDSSLINSTRGIGFFPLAFLVLIPVGVYRLLRHGNTIGRVVVVGVLTAPLAGVIAGAFEMYRIMFAIPFGVLSAAFGVQALITSPGRVWLVAAIILVATVPLQFAGFYVDYMGRYRLASSIWFGGNVRDALIAVIDREAPGATRPVYLARAIPYVDRYWRFYTIAKRRPDLIERAVYYDAQSREPIPEGAQLVCRLEHPECQALRASTTWREVATITEPDGSPSFAVLERRAIPQSPK